MWPWKDISSNISNSLPARLFDLGWRIDFLHAPETSETRSQGVLREFGIYYKLL